MVPCGLPYLLKFPHAGSYICLSRDSRSANACTCSPASSPQCSSAAGCQSQSHMTMFTL